MVSTFGMVQTLEKSLRTLSFKAGQLLSDNIHHYFSAAGEKSFFAEPGGNGI